MNPNRATPGIWPGLLLCVSIAIISFLMWQLYRPISGLIWAIVFGIVSANIFRFSPRFSPGIDLCSKRLLRLAIACLGIVTSATVWFRAGAGVVSAVVVIFFSFFLSLWLGKRLRVASTTSLLIGVGTSICGASAIAALGPAIKAREEEMGLSLASITLYGLLAMFAYPLLFTSTAVGDMLRHDLNLYAVWVGAGVHETAQVVAAASFMGSALIGPALLVKSVRIFMIGPMVLMATHVFGKTSEEKGVGKVMIPLYAVAFVIFSVLSVLIDFLLAGSVTFNSAWTSLKSQLSEMALPFLLAVALGGVGLNIKFQKIRTLGLKPLVLAAVVATLSGLVALAITILISSLA